jgi:endo-1,4-beta-xylanase
LSAPTRRSLLAASLALAACDGGRAKSQPASSDPAFTGPPPPLKALAPFPVGTCVMTGELQEPAFTRLLLANFSQITPEWEMKMEALLTPDGGYDFTRADAIAAYAREHGLRLYCTTLVWHQEDPPAFRRLDGSGAAFAEAYRDYILKVAGRYRGQAVGWDVVNEPVAEDGEGLRDCLWSRNLGAEDYMVRAFEYAAEADPGAVLIMNEYNLENLPKKRATFLRLVERLLKRGAPLKGLGTQTHLEIDSAPGSVKTAMRELAQFGLPIHVSELDVSTSQRALDMRPLSAKLDLQARLVAEVTEAFMDLPKRQRFALTVWGVRDSDSFMRRPPTDRHGGEQPLLFTGAGAPKPAFRALARTLKGAA